MVNGIFYTMNLSIDHTGRVVLPKPVREQFNLTAGSSMDMTVEANRIVLTPHQERPVLGLKGRLLVHHGSATGDILASIELSRNRRNSVLHGSGS
jgi:AbrB family looped-hinge helix DNA binding protein